MVSIVLFPLSMGLENQSIKLIVFKKQKLLKNNGIPSSLATQKKVIIFFFHSTEQQNLSIRIRLINVLINALINVLSIH